MLLINAVKGGRTAQVKMFIKVGIDVNEVDENGQTGLIHSCFLQDRRARIKILKALVFAGANVNKKDTFRRNVLSWACLKGKADVVRFLLNDPLCIDLQINVTDKDGNSTLLLAVMSGNFCLVKMMVGVLKGTARASELNKANNAGMRPLIAAFVRGDKICAQLLMKQVGASASSVLKYLKSLQSGSYEFFASSSVPLFESSRGKKQTWESLVQFAQLTEDDIFEFLFAKNEGSSDAQKCESASQELKDEKNNAEQQRILLSRRSGSKKQDSFLRQQSMSSRSETMEKTSEINTFHNADKCSLRPFTQETAANASETSKCASSQMSIQKLMVLYAEQNSPSFRHGLPICRYTPPQPQINTDVDRELAIESRSSCKDPSDIDPAMVGLSSRLLGESLMDQQMRLKSARNSRAASMQVPRLPSLSGSGRGRIKRTRSSTIMAVKL